jgi:2'-5' RNA ligase
MTSRTIDAPQLDLLGGHAAPAQMHRLFFALMPDEPVRAALARAAEALRAAQPGLRARWVAPARYHATMHFLGDHPMLRDDIVRAAEKAGDALRPEAFDWTLDCVATFRGREPPCVLRSSTEPEPLRRLWQDLREALIRAGLGSHVSRTFTPHVTLGYSRGDMLPETPAGPVAWRVDRLALVHNAVGQGNYRLLRTWPLA